MAELNNHEKAALRYYIGDVSGNDPFWSDPKAYVVLNSLFFDGTATEHARAAEGKYLNPFILEDTSRLTELMAALFSGFQKCSFSKERQTFRVERWSDYVPCRKSGSTISFMSTSTAGFLNEYRDRVGITLMKFYLPSGTPCIDIADALDYYAKPNEAEVLLPPFLELKITEVSVSERELVILDSDGKPPICSCMVTAGNIRPCNKALPNFPDGGSKAGQRIFKALNEGNQPLPEDEILYSKWKKAYSILLHQLLTK